jgi:hypothetical protein
VSPCEFYFSFSFRPTPPCCQRRSIALQNAGESRRALINFKYERKQQLRLIMKKSEGTCHVFCTAGRVFLKGESFTVIIQITMVISGVLLIPGLE